MEKADDLLTQNISDEAFFFNTNSISDFYIPLEVLVLVLINLCGGRGGYFLLILN